MSITREVRESGSTVIHVDGQFDFSVVRDFREAYQDLGGKEITIDLRNTDYLDSAALGMLLNMQSYLEKPDGTIRIVNAMPQIKRVLVIARFEKKFLIE